MEHVRCWICDNFYKFYNWRWPSRPGILCWLHRWFSYSSTPSEFCGAPFMHFVKKKSGCTMHFIPNQFISYMPLYVNHVLYEEYLLVTGRKIMSHLVNEILNETKWSFVQSPSYQKTLPPRTSLQYFGISNIYGTYCRQARYYVSQQKKQSRKDPHELYENKYMYTCLYRLFFPHGHETIIIFCYMWQIHLEWQRRLYPWIVRKINLKN